MQPVQPSQPIAIFEILCVLTGNVFSMIVGILSLVFYNDPQVKDFFARLNGMPVPVPPTPPALPVKPAAPASPSPVEAVKPTTKTAPKAPASPEVKKPRQPKGTPKKASEAAPEVQKPKRTQKSGGRAFLK